MSNRYLTVIKPIPNRDQTARFDEWHEKRRECLDLRGGCLNFWDLQPRDEDGTWLTYDGSGSKAEKERAEKRRKAWARKPAGADPAAGADSLVGAILGHLVKIMVASPPGVQRALAAWDAPHIEPI